MNTKQKIEVMQAWLDGKPIQRERKGLADWADWSATNEPVWCWSDFNYRIKPPVRKVKLLAYVDCDQFFWLREGVEPKWPSQRVPSEDKEVTLCTD